MSNMAIPPPPPVPTRQGPGGPPPPNLRPPGPPPPPPGFQLPVRQQVSSTRVSDITPRIPLDEDSARKRLTTYEAHTIRKLIPRDSKDKATWAKSEITKEPLSQEDISKLVKRLNESKRSVQDKKAALMPFQQGQVNRLLDELMTADQDHNFEWSLTQLDAKTFTNKKGQRETSTITVFVKRGPLKGLNPIGLFNAIERNKQARLEQMSRPPPRPEGHGAGGTEIIDVNAMKKFPGKFNSKLPRPPKKKYHDHHDHHGHSSSSSDYSSDDDSISEYSSEGNTTISTQSDRRSRRYSHKGRSHSRPREHRKKYYVGEPRYVPEAPRVIQAVPPFDPVAAAYQAGKIDADAERFGLDRYPRRSIAEPAAIVSYARPDRVYSEPRYVEYIDDREDDFIRREDFRREERRRREAEDYMERRGSDRLEPKIIYANPNPFAPAPLPRRYSYAPSHSTRDGW